MNDGDGILRSLRGPVQRALVVKPFIPSSEHPGQLAACFDMVLGRTPAA